MKVYFPINIDFFNTETSELYGWKDGNSSDIFICSNSKFELIPEFKVRLDELLSNHQINQLFRLSKLNAALNWDI